MSSPVDAILERIKAQRSFASTTLLLQEQGEVVIQDASTWRTLLSIPASALIRMGLTLSAKLLGQTALNVVQSGNVIGSARLSSDVGEVAITIEPKIPATRLVSVIDFMQSDSCFSDDLTETYSAKLDVLTLQVIRCLRLIASCLSSGSIRGYRGVQKDLPYIKGRVDYCRLFAQSHVMSHTSIRCGYFEHSIDTDRNQVFKAALIKIAKLLSERDVELFNAARLCLYSLSAVADREFSGARISQMARRNRRDATTLLACRDILCDLSISPHPGRARPFFSYAINMATLFQQYCYRLTTDALASLGIRPVKEFNFAILGLNEGIEVDGLFGEGSDRVLIEVKYKSIRSIQDASRGDIYQSIAYCSHANVLPRLAILFYPETSGEMPVRHFGQIAGFRIFAKHVHFVAINLSERPDRVRSALGDILRRLLSK